MKEKVGSPETLETPTGRKSKACRVCGRTHSRNGTRLYISNEVSLFPGVCNSCRISAGARIRTHPVVACSRCGRTRSKNRILLRIPKTGPFAGVCTACRVAEQRAREKEETTSGR